MKKKVLSVFLAAVCVASLTACGGSSSSDESSSDSSAQESAIIESRDDLEGKKIGVQQGTTGDLSVTDEFGDENVERYNKGFEAVQALTQDKIDAVVIDGEPAKEFVAESEGLKILDEAFTEEDYAIAVAKDNTELVDKINDALATLKESGELDEIIAKYITADSEADAE